VPYFDALIVYMIVFHYLQFEMVVYLIDDMIAYTTVYTIAGMKD
jgi:hypothetical protein